jgi:hypothetical protein
MRKDEGPREKREDRPRRAHIADCVPHPTMVALHDRVDDAERAHAKKEEQRPK